LRVNHILENSKKVLDIVRGYMLVLIQEVKHGVKL
jgi:hypothetical protein